MSLSKLRREKMTLSNHERARQQADIEHCMKYLIRKGEYKKYEVTNNIPLHFSLQSIKILETGLKTYKKWLASYALIHQNNPWKLAAIDKEQYECDLIIEKLKAEQTTIFKHLGPEDIEIICSQEVKDSELWTDNEDDIPGFELVEEEIKEERSQPPITRSCYACGTTESLRPNGRSQWYHNHDTEDNMLCKNCYCEYITSPATATAFVNMITERCFRQIFKSIFSTKKLEKEPKVLSPERICYACGTTKSIDETSGCQHWYHNRDIENNVLCKNCDKRYIQNPITTSKKQVQRKAIEKLEKEPEALLSERTCYWCGATESISNTTGYAHWYLNRDIEGNVLNALCKRCYDKYIGDPVKNARARLRRLEK